MCERARIVAVFGWVLLSIGASGPTEPLLGQAPTLTPAEYGQWERLGAFELDPTGSWLVASISRTDGTRELRLHRSDGQGEPLVLEHGTAPVFSADGRWMAYRKGVHPDDAEASEEPAQDRLGLVDLQSVTDSVLFDVASFQFRDDGLWLVAQGIPSADSIGGDLIVMDPASGSQTLIGNVDDFVWQDEGPLLAATLRTAWGTANGVVLFDPAAGTLRTLDSRDARYRSLTWDERSSRLAVMRTVRDEDEDEEGTHDVLVWEDVSEEEVRILEGLGRAELPDSHRVTEYAGIDFSDDGRTVFIGLRPWDRKAREVEEDAAEENPEVESSDHDEEDDVPPADVQVWHWDDDQILRAQEYRAGAISRQTLLAAWHLDDDRLVVLGDDLDEPVDVVAGGAWGVVPDYDPYLFERRFGAGTADWYRVDVSTGERSLVAEGLESGLVTRSDGEWALLYDDDRWSSVHLGSLQRREMAGGRSFTRSIADYDYPGPRPSWGLGGWIDSEEGVLLHDKHDVWRVGLTDGSSERLTEGAEAGVEYRVLNLDPEASFFERPTLDRGEEIWLSVRDLWTKESGFARVEPGGDLDHLVFEHARVAGLTKAAAADRYALRMERWDDSPDVFVGDANLDDLVQVTETNPFQDDFAWGRAELLGYTTDAGHDLQAVLVYPAGFVEGRQYPLILYQYERLSQNLHAYTSPSERSYYNYQAWSQQGYFVLMPDIVYEPGRPGPSALDAVEHALDAAVATGHVDPDAMGLIGHSWGGYQASYLPTRTNRFAASVAGAAITNFLSFMGAVHWNGGLPETGHWETGQARMAVPYWDDLSGHLESSPANYIEDLETPMLLMHGDEDGVVDFYQGMEFYNYARRAGKEVVLLVYPGADHGLTEESQQVDYHRRILEWFGHYLKGEPAAAWITEGESWVEREKRIGG